MFYTNRKLIKREIEMEWGTLYRYEAGEEGRGRRLLCLSTSPNAKDVEAGLHKNLTIGFTKTGRPRVNNGEDSKMYMLLSSEGGYTRRGDGNIFCLPSDKDKINVLSRGNGADGDAGRIGYWDVLLLEVSGDAIIRVRTSGAGYGTPSDFYIIRGQHVFHCTTDNLSDLFEALNISVPFLFDGTECSVKQEAWEML